MRFKSKKSWMSLLLLAVSGGVFAQSPDATNSQEYFQDWVLECRTQSEQQDCLVSQVLRTDEGQTAAIINVRRTKGDTVIEFSLPLLSDLTIPVSVSVDEQLSVEYPYNTCNQRACFVVRNGDQELLEGFKRGNQANINMTLFSQQKVTLQVSLKGFGRAYASLGKK